jgi:YbbR domain-containing protein
VRLRRWGRAWLQFAGFFVLAFFIWLIIETEQTEVVQRALEVPLSVTGLEPDRIPIGVPNSVIVIVSGADLAVERLSPDYFDAFIDLLGVEEEFDALVRVMAPQDVEVVDVTPGRVIGITEGITQRSVPVRLSLADSSPEHDGLRLSAQPTEVTVSGQETQVERVSFVTAMLESVPDEASPVVNNLFAVDAEGKPVADVRLSPEEVIVLAERESLLYRRDLPVELVLPEPDPLLLREVELSSPELAVAGSRESVLALERVEATVELPEEPGTYTLELSPLLPNGIEPLERLTVEVSLVAPEGGNASEPQ